MKVHARFLLVLGLALTLAVAYGEPRSSKKQGKGEPRFTLSGRIDGLDPHHHVALHATSGGRHAHQAITHDNGTFIFRNLEPGTYTVRPNHQSYSFSPNMRTVALHNHDVTDIHFTAHEHPKHKKKR